MSEDVETFHQIVQVLAHHPARSSDLGGACGCGWRPTLRDRLSYEDHIAGVLMPAVRAHAAGELLWAASEAECHHDLVMLKRRVDELGGGWA